MSENTNSFLCENSSKGNSKDPTTQTLPLSTGCTSKHLIWTFERRAVQYKLQDVYFPKSLSGQEEWLNSQGGPSFVLCSWSPDAHLVTPLVNYVDTAPPWAEGLAALKHSRNMRNCWTSPKVQTAAPHHLPSHHTVTAEAQIRQMESAHRLDLASSWSCLTS